MSTTTYVDDLPTCQICCADTAQVDGKTIHGPWAYMCPGCFAGHGVGFGTGRGQMLAIRPRR